MQIATQQRRRIFRNRVACGVSSGQFAQRASKARHNSVAGISKAALPVGFLLETWRRVLLKRHTTAAMEYQKPRCLWGFFWKICAACLHSVTQQCWNIFKNCVACGVSSRNLAQCASKARHNSGNGFSETALPVGFLLENSRSVLAKRDTTMSEYFQKLRCL